MNVNVSIDTSGLVKALVQAQAQIAQGVETGVLATAHEIADKAADYAPKRTGHLADGYEASPTEDGAQVTTDVEYAPFVEFGTRHMAGQFPLTRAVADAEQAAEQTVSEAITKQLR